MPPTPPSSAPSTPSEPRSATTTLEKSTGKANRPRAQSGQDLIQEELRHVLTMYRERRKDLDILKTPEIFIDKFSSPSEVQDWLKGKGFTERLCKQLNGMTGHELFSLSREQLEKACGDTEGHRLHGQLTIQKNVSGYKTARYSELKAILDKARKKVDDKDDELNTEGVSVS